MYIHISYLYFCSSQQLQHGIEQEGPLLAKFKIIHPFIHAFVSTSTSAQHYRDLHLFTHAVDSNIYNHSSIHIKLLLLQSIFAT